MECKNREYIFTYGVFREASKLLLGDSFSCGMSSVDGKIYWVNEFYPGFIRGSGKVWGDVYSIDPKVLPTLDEYEGDEYIREKIITHSDIESWIYVYIHDISNFKEIIGGDWLLRQKI